LTVGIGDRVTLWAPNRVTPCQSCTLRLRYDVFPELLEGALSAGEHAGLVFIVVGLSPWMPELLLEELLILELGSHAR
jgi:hypothetical protein